MAKLMVVLLLLFLLLVSQLHLTSEQTHVYARRRLNPTPTWTPIAFVTRFSRLQIPLESG
jgi:hypothetical protein